jgi:hypothetical protein
VSTEKFDFALFLERLILPAYWAGLAFAAVNAGITVSVIGQVESRELLRERILECAALIHPIPSRQAHPVDVLGRPVVQPMGMNLNQFISAAKRALQGNVPARRRTISPLSLGRILTLIDGRRWPRNIEASGNCSD